MEKIKDEVDVYKNEEHEHYACITDEMKKYNRYPNGYRPSGLLAKGYKLIGRMPHYKFLEIGIHGDEENTNV